MAAFGVQLLKRGLALCGENFAGFVDAWNHVVRRSANVCGDGDANPSEGLITVDNTDVDHPVIRLDTSRLPSGGGGGGGGGGDEDDCVTSLNEATGDMDIIGGKFIEVETDGQTIKISYNEEKTEEDEDPNNGVDPCDHDATGGAGGGVAVDGAGGDGGGAGGGSSEGGVVAGGEVHPGSGCNTCG